MDRISPLAIPELLALLGTLLSTEDLLSCIQVNKLWQTALEPILWRHATFDRHSDKNMSLETLCKNARRIQHLSFTLPCVVSDMPLDLDFVNLRTLTLKGSRVKLEQELQLRSIHFIQRLDPSVWDSIEMMDIYSTHAYLLWETLAERQEPFRSIVLSKWDVPVLWQSTFWTLCGNTTSLKLIMISLCCENDDEDAKIPMGTQWPLVRHLTLDWGNPYSDLEEQAIIETCPGLTSLEWKYQPDLAEHTEHLDVFPRSTCLPWSNLTRLSLTTGKDQTIKDMYLFLVLAVLEPGRLEHLSLGEGVVFGPLSRECLREHFGHLKTFHCQRWGMEGASKEGVSTMILDMLESSPQLESLRLPETAVLSVLKSVLYQERPWACTEIRELALTFELEAGFDIKKQAEAFLGRIGQLGRLYRSSRDALLEQLRWQL